jgi:hypothetical protein
LTAAVVTEEEIVRPIDQISLIHQPHNNKRIRLMDLTNLTGIIGRAFWQLKEINNGGYSRGDVHRKHIKERYEQLVSINVAKGGRLKCDKCSQKLELNTLFFIHQRKSFNKYYHEYCAQRMNMY